MGETTLAVRSSLAGVRPSAYWLDDPARPGRLPGLEAATSADLVVVGGGYLGLWTALLATERDPGRDVLVLEAGACGDAASGRNGGFCEASLTHGFGNGLARWPEEMPTLLRLGRENLDGIERTVSAYAMDCDFQRTGSLAVATAAHQLEGLREEYAEMRALGVEATWLSAEEMRGRVDSPTFQGGLHDPEAAIVEPARLAWGLREACLSRGVRIAEGTPALGLERLGGGVSVRTSTAPVVAGQVVLATNAFPPLLRRLRLMTVPVYDYVLMTEPLSEAQRASIGWTGREGWSDAGNQFIYTRTTRDGRILWGGYDAIYHYGSAVRPEFDQRPETFETLAGGFFATFPQLEGLAFSHAWSGVIDNLHPVHRVLRHRDGRTGRLRPRLHRPGSRRDAVRRRRGPRPPRRRGHRAHAPGDGAQQARPLPARTAPLGRHPRPPGTPSPGPTRTVAGRTSGSRRWAGSASASTPEEARWSSLSRPVHHPVRPRWSSPSRPVHHRVRPRWSSLSRPVHHPAGWMNVAAGTPSHWVTRIARSRSARRAVRRLVSRPGVQCSSSASAAHVRSRS